MQFVQTQWVDVSPFLASKTQPTAVLKRPSPKCVFWVPHGDVFSAPDFGRTAAGEGVRIPMNGYQTKTPSHAELFGMGVQIGMAAVDALREHTGDRIVSVLLVIGHQVTDLRPEEDGFRAYLGVALRTA